jgi:hypothetical protein
VNKRPISVTIISWIFIASGSVGFIYHITELNGDQSIQYETVWICFVRLLAIVGGAFMLCGKNWARWLSIVWIGCHVILSAFHSLFELVAHSLLFLVFAYLLFRPKATAYFRTARTERLDADEPPMA